MLKSNGASKGADGHFAVVTGTLAFSPYLLKIMMLLFHPNYGLGRNLSVSQRVKLIESNPFRASHIHSRGPASSGLRNLLKIIDLSNKYSGNGSK